MPATTPSLWDNLELQNGYSALSKLDLAAAKTYFMQAHCRTANERKEADDALQAIAYWEALLPPNKATNPKGMYEAFTAYPFPPLLAPFKKVLLLRSTEFLAQQDMAADWEPYFDLLLEQAVYDTAIAFLEKLIEITPEDHRLCYHFGQAWHRKKVRAKSMGYYGKALLLHPDEKMLDRVEPEPIKELLAAHSLHRVFLYGYLARLFPEVTIPKHLTPADNRQREVFELYALIRLVEQKMGAADRAEQINLRRKIKNIDPDIFDYLMQKTVSRAAG